MHPTSGTCIIAYLLLAVPFICWDIATSLFEEIGKKQHAGSL
jgi:hypothetical protein